MPVDEAVGIATQVAQGLAKAHESGIVHRDIKPANILITSDGVAKIVDVGLAKLSGRTMLTKTGSTLGTAAYMSPEQARGESVDHRTDIWSLGVVLYEVIAGRRPFASEYEQALVYQILNTEPEPLTRVRPETLPGLAQIVGHALAKHLAERYQTMEDFRDDLAAVAEGLKPLKELSPPYKTWSVLCRSEVPKPLSPLADHLTRSGFWLRKAVKHSFEWRKRDALKEVPIIRRADASPSSRGCRPRVSLVESLHLLCKHEL